MKELVSVVIRTWNREEDLRKTLKILQNEPYKPLEIIVVDNGSTDNTSLMVKSNFPEVKLITLTQNRGVAATNVGMQEARGRYILILDDDSYPQAGSILSAIDKFREIPKLGIISFKTIDMPSGFTPQLKFEKGKTEKELKEGIEVKIFRGGGFMIRKDIFESVGGFPEDFFWVGEESDLAFRIINAGYEIRYFPELMVIHRASPKNRILSKKTYYETRNLIWLYWKYSPIIMALLKTIYSAFYLGIKALRNKVGLFYLKGLSDGIKRLPFILRHRQVVYTQTLGFLATSFINKLFEKNKK